MRVTDVNNRRATMCIPLKETADMGQASYIRANILASIKPVESETFITMPIWEGAATGAGGPHATVIDIAQMVFKSTGPFGLKFPLIGPGAIFLPDTVTIDITVVSIANLIAVMLAFGTDAQGNSLTAYVSGRRLA